jgi:hypothetical protein
VDLAGLAVDGHRDGLVGRHPADDTDREDTEDADLGDPGGDGRRDQAPETGEVPEPGAAVGALRAVTGRGLGWAGQGATGASNQGVRLRSPRTARPRDGDPAIPARTPY